MEDLREEVMQAVEHAKEAAAKVQETVADVVAQAKEAAAEVQKAAAETVAQAREAAAEAVAQAKDEAAETAKETAADAVEEVKDAAADVVEEAKDAAADAVEEVKDAAADVVEEAKDAAADIADKAEDAAADAVEEAKDAAADIADKAEDSAAGAVEEVKDAAADIADKAEDAAAGTVEKAGEAAESMEDYAAELEASFRQINEGDILTGTVIGVTDTDITLDLGYYTDGIIHLADASDDPSFSLKDRIKVGQTLSATVVRRDDGAGHILLSTKEAANLLAWDRLRELKETQETVTVKITDVTKGGAIAYLEGMRGFIPASKLSLSYVEEDALKDWVGKSIDVRVITAEEEGKRLVMSARDILWEQAQEERARKISNVEVGLVTEGTVETIKPYGAFINLGDGLSGLLHVSQISQKRIKTPGEVLKEGDTVKVKIIANKDGKLSLSMKALEEAVPEEIHEEKYELPKAGNVTTSLGDLFAKLNL